MSSVLAWQRAFILHSYHYRETSLLIDFFTESKGRVKVLAKGVRRKQSSQKGILQPFTPLIIQYSGSGQIKTLRCVEAISLTLPLNHFSLYSAFYINELVHRVITAETDTTALFGEYLHCIQTLACQTKPAEYALRCFELALLENLGYKIDFTKCNATGEVIRMKKNYLYVPESGFYKSLVQDDTSFSGYQLHAFAKKTFPDKTTLHAAKRFTRLALKPYVGLKPFKSRELFIK